MLAKSKYGYVCEKVRAVDTVVCVRYDQVSHCFCKAGHEYPVANGDTVAEQMDVMKRQVTLALDKNETLVKPTEKDVISVLDKAVKELFKELKLRVIVESGYKETFYFDMEGEFVFDLSVFRKVGAPPSKSHDTTVFVYHQKTYDLVALFPSYFKARWSMQKNSL